MNFRSHLKPATLSTVVAGITLFIAASPTRSDVKIVSEINVTGLPQGQSGTAYPQSFTTYYKGEKARIEWPGTVTIYDTAVEKVYLLHPDDKTYSVVTFKKLEEMDSTVPVGGHAKQDAKLDVNRADDKEADAKRTFAGMEGHKYDATGSVRFSMGDRPSGFQSGGRRGGGGGGGFPGGGRRRGGGFPLAAVQGPGGGGQRGPRAGGGFPSMEMEGEFWIAEKFALPSKSKEPFFPSFALAVPPGVMAGPLLKPLADKMAKAKGFPLFSRVSVRVVKPQSAEEPEQVVTTVEVKSLSSETLDDALFKVPEDYKIVEAPSAKPAAIK
jgi:hypothetical protein